jgi:hypothetical protein
MLSGTVEIPVGRNDISLPIFNRLSAIPFIAGNSEFSPLLDPSDT